MVQQQRLRFMEMDIRWILILIFFHNQLIIFLIIMILILIQYLLQQRWRPWILIIQYSYLLIFWFCLSINQRFLFQWYSVLLRSCLLHLLFRWLIILGGIIIYRFRFWLHQQQLVLNLRILLLVRVFLLRFHWRKCWMHHLLLRWFCQMAFNRQVRFRVLNRIIPNMHYRLRYQLNQRELK